jgi:hypothetical protein
MKNKLLAVLATFGMVASASAVKINNNLSINGFIDGSWTSTDTNTANEPNDDTDIDIDEVEVNFIVNVGNVSGEIHIDDNDDSDNLGNIEQAHFTYSFSNGVSLQVGRTGSALGLEREDPAGLYTYSRAYDDGTSGFNLGNVDAHVFEGVRLAYSTDTISASVAAFNGVSVAEENTFVDIDGDGVVDVEDTARDTNDLDYEVAVSFTGIENLSLSAGIIAYNASENDVTAGTDADLEIFNINAAYTLDKLLLAAEYTNIDVDGAADDLSAYLLLADYDINDQFGIAVRYSEWETAAGDSDRITIAPNYAITESLGAILEYSSAEDANNAEEDTLALELTFTF